MADFFVSYSAADRDWAEWIAWQLESTGDSAQIAEWDFLPGSNFVLEMESAVRKSERVLALISPDYLSSRFAQSEWNAAFSPVKGGPKLLPIRIRECELSGIFGSMAYVDLVGKDEAAARETLLRAVSWLRQRPSQSPIYPTTTEQTILFPADRLEVSNLPLRNPWFVGREHELENLRRGVQASRAGTPTIQSLVGMAGVGKTQITLEYCYRFREYYRIIWWMRGRSVSTIRDDYDSLIRAIGIGVRDNAMAPNGDESVEIALAWLCANPHWLLVLDDASDPSQVLELLPHNNKGDVIVTSRDAAWRAVGRSHAVDVLTRVDALHFLVSRTDLQKDDAVSQIAERLGNLPLALDLAASAIRTRGITATAYLRELESASAAVVSSPTGVSEISQTIGRQFASNFKFLAHSSPQAVALMRLLAFLAPADLPASALIATDPCMSESAASGLPITEAAVKRSIEDLGRLSLLTVKDQWFVQVHPLLQAFVRETLDRDARKAWAETAVRLISSLFSFDARRPETWSQSAPLVPHAIAAARHAAELGSVFELTAQLWDSVGLWQAEHAQLVEAEESLRAALSLAERAQDYGNKVAAHANNLARVLQQKGDLKSALEYAQQALSITEREEPESSTLAKLLSNQAQILLSLGHLSEARRLTERALSIDEKVLGTDHPNVAVRLNNLGQILHLQGDSANALKMLELAFHISEKAYGQEHPATAIAIGNLSRIYRERGQLNEALKYAESALRVSEKCYGPEHPNVAEQTSELGAILADIGDFEGAVRYTRLAVEVFTKALGGHHPDTATAQYKLGWVYARLGQRGDADACYRAAFETLSSSLGEEHPVTLHVKNQLAKLELEQR